MLLEENFLRTALDQAKIAKSNDEVPVGAILVKDNKILAVAHNTRELDQDPTGHAECNVIRKAANDLCTWRLDGCEIYVTLEPCLMCLAVCQQSRISKVFYGAKDLKGGAISLGYTFHQDKKLNHRFELEYFPIPECESILKEYFKNKRDETKK